MTRAAPQSRSLGSSLCARFTRSWTPVRIFTVRGTSSTCRSGCGQHGPRSGREGGDIVGRTWFMQRTICWNLAERFMRAQPPPWERQAAGVRKCRTEPGPDTPTFPCCICGETAARRAGRSAVTRAGASLVPGLHPTHTLPSGVLEPSGCYLLVHEVDGAANIDIHKIHLNGAVQQLSTLGHGVGEGALQLWQVAGWGGW